MPMATINSSKENPASVRSLILLLCRRTNHLDAEDHIARRVVRVAGGVLLSMHGDGQHLDHDVRNPSAVGGAQAGAAAVCPIAYRRRYFEIAHRVVGDL